MSIRFIAALIIATTAMIFAFVIFTIFTSDASATEPDLTGAQICEAIPVEAIAEATGGDVTSQQAGEGAIPNCMYMLSLPNNSMEGLMIMLQTPTDGASGTAVAEAYNTLVEATARGFRGAVRTELEIGEGATRLTTDSMLYAFLLSNDRIFTIQGYPASVSEGAMETVLQLTDDAFSN